MTSRTVDITIFGTGEFSARALFDLAAAASEPLTVQVVGRDEARLAWLRTAANARAMLFGRPLRVVTSTCPTFDDAALEALLSASRPRVVFQTASLQTASVIRVTDTAWSQLVREGGFSATAPFHAVLSLRIARVVQRVLPQTPFVNACFPDVVNPVLAAAGAPALCGVGNIGILSSAFAGAQGLRAPGRLRILAHYQQLAAWRLLPAQRSGPTPRVWLDGREIDNVFDVFADVMLSPQAAFDISGATGVPLLIALARREAWQGHVPGPMGLPGGYPVSVDARGALSLDLPEGLSEAEAAGWNQAFEEAGGLTVEPDGHARYHGRLRELLAIHDPALARGFHCAGIESVAQRLAALRDRLQEKKEA